MKFQRQSNMKRCHVLRRPGSLPAPKRQGGAGSPARRTAGCLLLPSRFRRAEPAASSRASNTVITCGGVHGAQWMGIDRQGAFSALAPTTNSSMSVGDCQQCGIAVDGDRSSGSFLGIGAYYERQHVGGGLPTARHAARTSRGPGRSEIGRASCRERV